MGRSLNKDADAAPSVPERRSTRHSKPPEEEAKSPLTVKGKKSVGKKKEDKVDDKKKEENVDGNNEDSQEEVKGTAAEKNHRKISETEAETSNAKPTTSRRSGRKRQLSEEVDADDEDSNEKKDEKSTDDKNGKEDVKDDHDDNEKNEGNEKKDENHDKSDKDLSLLKNGQAEGSSKGNTKKKRKPPTKKKKVEQDESEMWTPLEPLDGDERRDSQKKTQSKSDRRKQALVERQAPAEPMLQKQPPRQRRNSDTSECEVLVNVPRGQRRSRTIVTVDIDDEASETGSIQIVAEPDVDSVFDFKRLLIQYRNVNLPSSLWGAHKDPRNLFVSFSRFNPDYPEFNGQIVDRAVVFKGTLNPEAYVSGEKVELPEMFNVVETIYEASQVVQFVNNTVWPVNHPTGNLSEAIC